MEKFECSNCGELVDNDALFCSRCGAKFEEEKPKKEKPETLYCSMCGGTIKSTDKRCKYCGAWFDDVEEEEVPANSYVQLGYTLGWISFVLVNPFCILSIIGIIFSAIGLSQTDREDEENTKKASTALTVNIISTVLFIVLYIYLFSTFYKNNTSKIVDTLSTYGY